MKIDINYKPEKRIDISAFAFASEGDYITVKKINDEVKQKIKYHQMGSGTNDFSKWMLNQLASGEIKPVDMVKSDDFQEQYNKMIKSMDDSDIEKQVHCEVMVEKLTIDYGLDTDNHSITDINDKKIYLNHETLKKMVELSPKFESFVRFIIQEITKYNTEDAICLGESNDQKLVM